MKPSQECEPEPFGCTIHAACRITHAKKHKTVAKNANRNLFACTIHSAGRALDVVQRRLGQPLPTVRRGFATPGRLWGRGFCGVGGRSHGGGHRGFGCGYRCEAQEGAISERDGVPAAAAEPGAADTGNAHTLGRLV